MTENSTRIHALELGPMENFIYLIEDIASRQAAVVDPAWDVSAIIDKANQLDLRITDILLTHSHHDHINGIEAVLEKYDAQLHLLKAEARFWGHGLDLPTLHHGGDRIELGETAIRVLHTPGHTPGSACYHIGDHLITGDTLFVGDSGRTDLPGGDRPTLGKSIRRLMELPDHTVIWPGHNYGPTPSSTGTRSSNDTPHP